MNDDMAKVWISDDLVNENKRLDDLDLKNQVDINWEQTVFFLVLMNNIIIKWKVYKLQNITRKFEIYIVVAVECAQDSILRYAMGGDITIYYTLMTPTKVESKYIFATVAITYILWAPIMK